MTRQDWHPKHGDFKSKNAAAESRIIKKRLRKKLYIEIILSIIFIILLIVSFIIF